MSHRLRLLWVDCQIWAVTFWLDVRICCLVQWIKFQGWLSGCPTLKGYTWRQIACGLAAGSLRQKQARGLEVSARQLESLRNLEQRYRVCRSPL